MYLFETQYNTEMHRGETVCIQIPVDMTALVRERLNKCQSESGK